MRNFKALGYFQFLLKLLECLIKFRTIPGGSSLVLVLVSLLPKYLNAAVICLCMCNWEVKSFFSILSK